MCSPFSHLSIDVSTMVGNMVGRSVENANEIRPDIKTLALLSRGSMDIYADICSVYDSNLMSIFAVCRRIRKFSAVVGL